MGNKKEFNPVKYYLENSIDGKEINLWDEEIEKIMLLAKRADEYRSNVGMCRDRLEHNNREMAFHEQWLKENLPEPGINYGRGVLQDLFTATRDNNPTKQQIILEEMTNRDRMIVATVIQWLGSNCGMAFLGDSLGRFGAKIIMDHGTKKEREY